MCEVRWKWEVSFLSDLYCSLFYSSLRDSIARRFVCTKERGCTHIVTASWVWLELPAHSDFICRVKISILCILMSKYTFVFWPKSYSQIQNLNHLIVMFLTKMTKWFKKCNFCFLSNYYSNLFKLQSFNYITLK